MHGKSIMEFPDWVQVKEKTLQHFSNFCLLVVELSLCPFYTEVLLFVCFRAIKIR